MKNDTPQEEMQLIHRDFDVPVKFISGSLSVGGSDIPLGLLDIQLQGSSTMAMYLIELGIVTKDNANYWDLPSVEVLHPLAYADCFGVLTKEREEYALSDPSNYLVMTGNAIKDMQITDKYFVRFHLELSSDFTMDTFTLRATFVRESTANPTLTDLIEAVHKLGYVLFHQGVGLKANGLPSKLYTSGADYYVEHPDFGRLPGGLEYIDLRSWNGENWQFSEADVKITG